MKPSEIADALRKIATGSKVFETILADAKLDSPLCIACPSPTPATKFYTMTERAGFYGEYLADFVLMLCDEHDYVVIATKKLRAAGGEDPIRSVTLEELKVMKVMNE